MVERREKWTFLTDESKSDLPTWFTNTALYLNH